MSLATGAETTAHHQRSDVAAVPAAGIVAEAMVALVLADAMLEKFGGDSVAETRRNMRGRIEDWATSTPGRQARFHLAPGADHGSAPFALLPDALRHASVG